MLSSYKYICIYTTKYVYETGKRKRRTRALTCNATLVALMSCTSNRAELVRACQLLYYWILMIKGSRKIVDIVPSILHWLYKLFLRFNILLSSLNRIHHRASRYFLSNETLRSTKLVTYSYDYRIPTIIIILGIFFPKNSRCT